MGTTDEEYLGDPAGVAATEADVDQILGEIGQAIPEGQLSRSDIVYPFAVLRVLPGGTGHTKKARRETVVSTGPGSMVGVAGGKWTTFRHIGTTVLDRIRYFLPDLKVETGPALLPGAAQPEPVRRLVRVQMPELPEDVVAHLVRHYGSRSDAIDHEWRYDVDDVLRRRTTLAVRGLDTPEIRKRVCELIGS